MSTRAHKKKRVHHASPAKKKTNWLGIVGLILMLGAIFTYVATLDEGDPEALPTAEGTLNTEAP